MPSTLIHQSERVHCSALALASISIDIFAFHSLSGKCLHDCVVFVDFSSVRLIYIVSLSHVSAVKRRVLLFMIFIIVSVSIVSHSVIHPVRFVHPEALAQHCQCIVNRFIHFH